MRDPDGLLARASIHGDPNRDQHFLIDDRVLDRLPEYARERGSDMTHVLEIGAGTGALTDRLLAVPDTEHVTAIERDPELVAFLHREFADDVSADRLSIVEGDALSVVLPDFTASVSNLPYGISSPILFRLLPLGRPLVLMLQKEFAVRMVAKPDTPEYGRLSVSTRHFADVEIVETVPPSAFSPQPAVESAVIRTTPREPDYEVEDEEFFLVFVKAVFTQRRKTLRNAIRNTTHITGITAADAVVDAIDDEMLHQRAGELSPDTFAELATVAGNLGGVNVRKGGQ